MKALKAIIITTVFTLTLFKCGSVSKLTNEAPKALKEAYYQNWNSGVKDGGSGTDLYIRLNENSIILDSIYFRGQLSKLNKSSFDNLLYVSRFKSNIQISNKLEESVFFQFQIKENECVISYKLLGNKTLKYHKIMNVQIQNTINYPSNPSGF
jgi:hypothetical protein